MGEVKPMQTPHPARPVRLVRAGLHPLAGTPTLPGAKYTTVRAVLLAALAAGESSINGVARTEDTAVLLGALRTLGIAWRWEGTAQVRITGCAGQLPNAQNPAPITLDVGNAGAVARLLMGICATLPQVRLVTDYHESLGQRPNADLLDALRQLGVAVEATGKAGNLPITLRRGQLHGGPVAISATRSSQYLSALLLLAPLIGEAVSITVTGELRSGAFARLTAEMLTQVGIQLTHSTDLRHWTIPSPQVIQPRDWYLARDFPSAATWLAAGAIAGKTITVGPLAADAPDGQAVVGALRAMGAVISESPAAESGQMLFTVRGGTPLQGVTLNGEPMIDSIPVLAAAACCAVGTTVFTHVGTLRLKESNRIDDLCSELNRAGAHAEPGLDSITISGQPSGIAGGVTVDAHHDHRLAMALAILALRTTHGLTITGAHHVAKSYPDFWDELARLGAVVEG